VIAPDWRGFGLTEAVTDSFWFPDYLADLDFLIDALCPDQAIDLVGHSMGGNICLCYAGSRPERIARAVNLEGFGLAQTAVAKRLMKTNPRLDADKALWLAQHWARADEKGQWHVLGQAAHKVKNPYLYRWDEMQEVWKRITAPVLSVEASDDSLNTWWKGSYTLQEYHERLKNIAQVRSARIEQAGHMLHHDQPQALAELIEGFLA